MRVAKITNDERPADIKAKVVLKHFNHDKKC